VNERRTILLIEDKASDVDLTRRALKKGGIANPVAVARDGKESSAGGELRHRAEFRFGVQRVAQKATRS